MKQGDTFVQNFIVDFHVYEGFMNTFKDTNPLHTNNSFAKSKGFDDIVMFGNILNGFLSYFIGECLPIKNVIIQTQAIKFYNPVFLNDKLKLCAEIVGVHDSVKTVELRYVFENQNSSRVAKGKIQIGIL
jgi:3-hydroxybutyryl-CoA dehydratase